MAFSPRVRIILARPHSFAFRVLQGFRANQGLLLSGAIAYYTLLSIIPLFALLLLVLSHVVEEQQLIEVVRRNLEIMLGGPSQAIMAQVEAFLLNREVAGWLVFLVLVFFSSLAFTVLENAMSVIFFHRVHIHRRHFLISAVLPYLYIFLLGIGLLLVSMISGALQTLRQEPIVLMDWSLGAQAFTGILLYALGFMGMVILLTSIYLVMPVGRLSIRHALIGGISAAILWEIARHVLVWYFSTLSVVNLIYGSLTTTIVALVFLEVAGMILLLGAQVIAEFERLDPGTPVSAEEAFHCEDCEAPEENPDA
ncbi:MAG: YihY/virulence factor BrkB family protein [Pseudomonadota bacterium]